MAKRSLDKHEPIGYNCHMTMITTASFTVTGRVEIERLRTECRIMAGTDAENLQVNGEETVFDLKVSSSTLEDDIPMESYFCAIAQDLSRWLGVEVRLQKSSSDVIGP